MDVVEVTNLKDYEGCTYNSAIPVPHYNPSTNPSDLQGIKIEHQIEGFVVWPNYEHNNPPRYFISKNFESCKQGLKVELAWFIADGR